MTTGFRRLDSPLASPVPADDSVLSVPVRDEAARAALAIAHSCAVPTAFKGARAIPAARHSAARALVARLLGAPDAPSDDELASAVDELVAVVRDAMGEALARRLPETLDRATDTLLAEAGQALRTQALEHHGSDLVLASGDDGLVAICAPVNTAQAHAWLLQPLYERVEEWVEAYVPAAREREASRWWFSRWRSHRPFRGDEFARGVREQEFSLVERSYACLGVSPLEYMVEDDLLGDAGPRERHLARCLVDSVTGVWTVEARQGADVTLRHPLNGIRYRVREHAPEHRYGAGGALLGRLIPLGDGTWLRSPGAPIIASGDSPGLVRGLAEGLERGREGLAPQVAVEAMFHALAGVRGLPRDVRPDATPDEAADLLKEFHDTLREVGAAEEVDPATEPEAAEIALRHRDAMVVRLKVDDVLAEYTSALFELSKRSRSMRQTQRRRERDAKKRRKK